MPYIDRLIDIASDGHGVLFKNKDPKKLPSAVKFPLKEEDLQVSRTFNKPDIPRGLYYAYVTPVGLSDEFRMTSEEAENVKWVDPALSVEQTEVQIQMFKRDFLDNYEADLSQAAAVKPLARELGLKLGVLTGTPGFLYSQTGVWIREQGMDQDLYEIFCNRNREKGPTLSKLVSLRILKPEDFVEDSLYTGLAAAAELEWLTVHNPLSFDEALRRELATAISVKSPDDMPESLKARSIDLMLKRGGDRIKFNSGLPEILAERRARQDQQTSSKDRPLADTVRFSYQGRKTDSGLIVATA